MLTDTATITALELASRLSSGSPVTVLDVREDASGGVAGPGVTSVHVPAATVEANPEATARGLSGSVVVLCNRGVLAARVAASLRSQGVDAIAVEGGVRAWIAALQVHEVALGIDGLDVLQVLRPGRGCLSYVIASGGRALVVDPAPDARFYLESAQRIGATITDVIDTHLHADHLSGARALAERAGARLRLPELTLERGVADAGRIDPLADGDIVQLGAVAVQAIALPGHTTDMTGLLVAGQALVGGDSLFGDGIARPDLQKSDPAGA